MTEQKQTMKTPTSVGLGVGAHPIVELQLTLQGVDELSALTQLLLQKGHLMLEPGGGHPSASDRNQRNSK